MVMVRWNVVLSCGMLMARRAGFVARMLQFQRMRVVAVSAADAFMKHLALHKRSIHVNFVFDLSVVVVRVAAKQFQVEVAAERIARLVIRIHQAPATVTRRARFQLSRGVFAFQLSQPVTVVSIPEERVPTGHLDVQTRGAVARFATDVDL